MKYSGKMDVGRKALVSIGNRVDRTPTSVHFIGSSSFEKFRFVDDPYVDEIITEWNGESGSTSLWQYISTR